MKYGPIIFLGVLTTFAAAWLALVALPYLQLGHLEPAVEEGTGVEYPRPLAGDALAGQQIYAANGCIYCHTQQVRPEGFGADFERGWGPRRTVARDYLFDKPVMLGTMRTGPDLANIGARRSDVAWHHLHLYNPRATSPGSNMPAFAFLYVRRKIVGQRSAAALDLKGEFALPADEEVVPTDSARALVAYLQRQDRTFPLADAER